MCLNPHDPQLIRIFHESGAFHSVCANNGGGMARDGVMHESSICFAQNTRDELRVVGGGVCCAIAANPGMKQQNYILQTEKEKLK